MLLERLQNAGGDAGLLTAYGSALGQLRAGEATEKLLSMLRTSKDSNARSELALALARIVGDEQHYIRLLRETNAEVGTGASQAISDLKEKLEDHPLESRNLLELMDECADTLARQDLEQGVPLMSQVILQLPVEQASEACRLILQDCAERLDEFGTTRIDYIVLALHTAKTALEREHIGVFARAFSPENSDS
jgi:hypothetical protein